MEKQLQGYRIGIGMTGSFCMFERCFAVLDCLKQEGAELTFLISGMTEKVDCRFGSAKEFRTRMMGYTKNPLMTTIEEAEHIGPNRLFDLFLILPCTGNTMAKLANGITDTTVLMGVKAHLRNNLPVVISLSTNDGLGMNLKNIGTLLPAKNIFFVPFGQDNAKSKPNSLVAHTELVKDTIIEAMKGKQIEPVLQSWKM